MRTREVEMGAIISTPIIATLGPEREEATMEDTDIHMIDHGNFDLRSPTWTN